MVKQRSMTDISDQNTETGYMGLETQNDDMMPKTEDGDAKTKGMSGKLAVAVIVGILIVLAASAASAVYMMRPPKGCEDYTVQMHQYYV